MKPFVFFIHAFKLKSKALKAKIKSKYEKNSIDSKKKRKRRHIHPLLCALTDEFLTFEP